MNGKWTRVTYMSEGIRIEEPVAKLSLADMCELHDTLNALIKDKAYSQPALEVVK